MNDHKEYDQFKKEAEFVHGEFKKQRKGVAIKVVGAILFLAIVGFIAKVLFLPLFVADTVVDSAKGVVTKTLDSDNVIQNYEWFKQTYRDVLAAEAKITTLEDEKKMFMDSAGDRKDWSFEDKNEYSRLGSTISGLKNHRQDLVAQYNARSKMMNRSIFKGSDVPYELN